MMIVSAGGPWLKYRGHLENISQNCLIGLLSSFCLFEIRFIDKNNFQAPSTRLMEKRIQLKIKSQEIGMEFLRPPHITEITGSSGSLSETRSVHLIIFENWARKRG
jgi:hypothetical protein